MSAPLCVNPRCRKPRKLRKGSTASYEGARGLCRTCHSAEQRAAEDAPDPYAGPRWYERTAGGAAERERLKSGWAGYRPSTGTARAAA